VGQAPSNALSCAKAAVAESAQASAPPAQNTTILAGIRRKGLNMSMLPNVQIGPRASSGLRRDLNQTGQGLLRGSTVREARMAG
jgi:hypothetical protein